MDKQLSDWIEIARTGRFTDMSGREVELTPARLDAIAASLDEEKKRVPLVFGHPKLNAPAWGWAVEAQRKGDKLLARFRDVPETVKGLVRDGRYQSVSMRLAPDWSLDHVGLLGAAQPAIDGLKPVSFSQESDGFILVFAKPEETMDPSEQEALKKQLEDLKTKVAALESALKQTALERDEEKAAFAAFRQEQVENGRTARFESLVKDGKALPKDKEQILSFAQVLAKGGEEQTMAFAAPGGTAEKVSPEECFWRDLESRKPHGLFAEFAAPVDAEEPDNDMPAGNLAAKF